MLIIYVFIIFLFLRLSNYYLVWLIIEIIFLFFLLWVVSNENKSIGLIIYYFFQRVLSIILFIGIVFIIDQVVFFLLIAKLGLFPFFYWVVIVSVKIGIFGNIFILRLQKISVFRLVWLVGKVRLGFLVRLIYCRIIFVVFRLILVRDVWLLLVYSSIANTGILLIRVVGSNYIFIIILYLRVVLLIIYRIKKMNSFNEIRLIVFFFLVIPPFILFFIKFYVIFRLDFMIKVGFFLAFLDVLVLLYYFRLVFIKFMLIDRGILIYLINLLLVFFIILLRNCVTMIIFYKS